MSLPMVHGDELIGGINLYAARTGAFRGKHEALAAALGATAEGAMADADLDFSTRELARQAPRHQPRPEHPGVEQRLRARVDVEVPVARQPLKVEVVVVGDLVGFALHGFALLDLPVLAAGGGARGDRDQTTSDPSIIRFHAGIPFQEANAPALHRVPSNRKEARPARPRPSTSIDCEVARPR